MIVIPLQGASKCVDAAEWCQKEFNRDEWDLWMSDFRGQYTFEFERPEAAAWFALRWAE